MQFLLDLWPAILVSAVGVFVASSVIHMATPMHKSDYGKLPAEDEILAVMRNHQVQPGAYMFPIPGSMKDMQSPEMIEKYNKGPVGIMTLLPNGPPAIGKNLILWFLYTVIVGVFVAYIARINPPANPDFLATFRLTGAIAVFGYALAALPDSIWKGQPWITTGRFVVDGVIYGVLTGIAFSLLWPSG